MNTDDLKLRQNTESSIQPIIVYQSNIAYLASFLMIF